MSADAKPRLAVTVGDPAGIGPEVAARALADEAARGLADGVVFGPPAEEWARRAGVPLPTLDDEQPLNAWDGQVAGLRLVAVESDLADLAPAAPSAAGGEASIRYVRAAIDAATAGRADAIVTGPISKHAVRLAGYPWPGHTELLAEAFGADEVAMMFAGGPLRVVLVTIHVALAEAVRTLSADRIVTTCRLADEALRRYFGLAEPRLGVCGVNPHAGEEGRFGSEERDVIEPALARLQSDGIRAEGPLPPDTAFHQALAGRFDIVVAMYHDQGLIAVKTVAFEESVNVTLGLPVVRTSVDHGTAYDIAGRGQADPRSMVAAIRLAAEMVGRGKA
ncbi:MAG: 4-hydroxythreonine-4-phosphate dehydrogenase PdxA [Phycisphaerae bacterium]